MIYAHLLEFELDTPTYLTDFHRNYSDDGKTYIAGKLAVNEAIKQKSEPSSSDFSVVLSAVDQTMVSVFTSQEYKGRRCVIYRVEFDDNENIINKTVWMDGFINNYVFSDTIAASTMKIVMNSVFSSFKRVRMKDINLTFSETINEDETIYWGKNTPVTNTYSGNRSPKDPSIIE